MALRDIFRRRRASASVAPVENASAASLCAREATVEDIAMVRGLLTAEAYRGHFAKLDTPDEIENFLQELIEHTSELKVGRPALLHLQMLAVGDKPVGFIVLRGCVQPTELELHALVIAPNYRRHGYARETLQDILTTLATSNRRLLARCLPASIAMMALLDSMGFSQKLGIGMRVRHYLSPTTKDA